MDNLTVNEWFGHNMRNCTPAEDAFLELEAGKTVTFEIGCNRAFTKYRPPEWSYEAKPLLEYCCPEHGPLHTANKYGTPYNKLNVSLFGGTALAIAYESDPYKVNPEDMVVISVNYTSPWFRLVDYQIPEGLPPCPKGGCTCTWNWVHTRMNGEGYGNEIVSTDRSDWGHVGACTAPAQPQAWLLCWAGGTAGASLTPPATGQSATLCSSC
jgi:hypothetical protein